MCIMLIFQPFDGKFYGYIITQFLFNNLFIYAIIQIVENLAFLFLGEIMSGNAQFGGALVLIGVIGRGLLQAVQTKKGRTHE